MIQDLLLVAVAVALLWKTASWFVEGAVGVAMLLRLPKILIGLVLVSLATTAPELFTSLIAALRGFPEMALGNAMGSVIVDASMALGLAAIIASVPLTIDPAIFRISAYMVLLVLMAAFLFVFDGTLGRLEGAALLCCYVAYIFILFRHYQKQRNTDELAQLLEAEGINSADVAIGWWRVILLFGAGLAGVLLGSELLVRGASHLASALGFSPVVIGLTVTAIGTSMPEIATCVASAIKRESAIGVGNIIGADILNVCWVAGASAIANPLTAERSVLFFMFPSALIIVGTMVVMLRMGYALTRWNGVVLVALYCIYTIILLLFVAPPTLS